MRAGSRANTSREYLWQILLLLCPILLTLLLYWPTISQPYFWDDVPHYDFATTRTYSQLWTDVRGLSYYRPLTFTLYKFLFEALPQGETTLPHLLLLFVHTANAWLVGNLLRTILVPRTGAQAREAPWGLGLTAGRTAGLLASLLFVTYPFAVLPVSHFAAFMHPLVTFFTLGTTLSAVTFVTTGRWLWFPLAIALAILAPFVHESGVMAGAVAMAILVFYDWPIARNRWQLTFLLPFASVVFLPVWWLVPKTPNTFQWTGWGGILASTLFFAQGPTFPLQPLSRLAMDQLAPAEASLAPAIVGLPLGDLAAIGMVSLLGLIVSGLVLWRAKRLRILGSALAWTALVALPSIVVLPFPYITVSQRLLYSSGPAAALLWAMVCVSLASPARSAGIRFGLAAGLACIAAALPVVYVRREMTLHELALRPLEVLADIAREYPDGNHLTVNAVNWLNYKQPWYALGQEGVSVSADYVDFQRLVQINSGNQARFAAATYPAIKAELARFYYSTVNEEAPWDATSFGERAAEFDQIWLTVYRDDATGVLAAGAVTSKPDAPVPEYLASFDGKAYLLDAELDIQGDMAVASLRWKYSTGLGETTVFRHLYDCEGHLIGQGDGHPLAGMLPWAGLAPGTEVHDIRHIALEAASADGCYVLSVGLYYADGQRVPVWDPDGVSLPDATVSRTFLPGGDP